MMYLLLFVFPAVLSLKIKDDFFKEEMSLKDYVFVFIKYVLFINLIIFGVLFLYSKGKDSSISYAVDNISFIFKYLVLSIFSAMFVPIIDEYIKKYVSIKISLKYEGKNNDKKK